MSLITKLSQLFSKTQSQQKLGITLRNKEICFCYLPDEAPAVSQTLAMGKKTETQVLAELTQEHELHGQACLVLSAAQYQIVQVEKPNVPEKEILAALKWQIKDLVSYDPIDMILDYFDGPELIGASPKINVVCSTKSLLQPLVNAFTDSAIHLKKITTEEFAFASLLPVEDDACLLVCQQPNEEIIIMIVKQGLIHFHRRLRGFANIANETEEALALGTIDRLSLEIQRSTDYFERQLKQAPIKAIKSIIPIALESYLVSQLAENTHIPVTIFDLPAPYQAQRETAAALGAAMLDSNLVGQVTAMEATHE